MAGSSALRRNWCDLIVEKRLAPTVLLLPRCARIKSERAFKIRINRSLQHEMPTQARFFVLTKGMSVVGPRPALPKEVAAYTPRQEQRLLVKPGMTCYWQTRRNRDAITFDEWVELDL